MVFGSTRSLYTNDSNKRRWDLRTSKIVIIITNIRRNKIKLNNRCGDIIIWKNGLPEEKKIKMYMLCT